MSSEALTFCLFCLLGVSFFLYAAAWNVLGADWPETHRFISEEEKAYILPARMQLTPRTKKVKIWLSTMVEDKKNLYSYGCQASNCDRPRMIMVRLLTIFFFWFSIYICVASRYSGRHFALGSGLGPNLGFTRSMLSHWQLGTTLYMHFPHRTQV